MPTLLAGRALYFKGQYDGEKGAKKQFLNARPPDAVIDELQAAARRRQAAQAAKTYPSSKRSRRL